MTQTVLLTGASGYIANHIALQLLEAGYHVRGTIRDLRRGSEVTEAVRRCLSDDSDLEARLTFVALDLTADAGWTNTMDGIDVMMHTASPFPLDQPKHEDDLIRPAVDGAIVRCVRPTRQGITRVVLTSSTAAISVCPARW
jgi:dihydroflavonol-4-reductase